MKKKIINGLLMMALIVATTSSFVSCKDTVGDDISSINEKLYEQDDLIRTVLLVQISNLQNDLSLIKNLKTVNNGTGGYLGEVPFLQKYEELLQTLEALTKGVGVPGTGTGQPGTTASLADWINAVNQMLADLYGQGGATTTSIKDIIDRLVALEGKSHDQVDLTDIINRLTALEGIDVADIINRLTALENQEPVDLSGIIARLTALEGQLPVDLSDIIARLTALEGQAPVDLSDIIARLTALEGQAPVDLTDIINRLAALEAQTAFDPSEIIARLVALEGNYEAQATQIATLLGQVSTLDTKVQNNAADILTLTNTVNTLAQTVQTQLDDLKTKLNTLESKFDGYYTKSEVDAIKQEIVDKFGSYYTKTEMDNLLQQIDNKFAGYYTKAEVDQFITDVKNMFNDYYTKTQVDNLINTLNEKFANYYTKSEIDAMKEAVEKRIKDLEDHQIVVDDKLKAISDSLKTAYDNAANALAEIETIKTTYATKAELKDSVAKLRNEILEAQLAAQDYAKTLVDSLGLDMKDSISAVRVTIGEMQSAIETLQNDVKEIKDKLENLESRIETLEEKVSALEGKVDKILDAQAKQVTGIIVQGAYSPVFGIGKLPVGLQTNILAAYAGRFYKEVTFPGFESTNYVEESECFTPEEVAIVAGVSPETVPAGIVMRDADDNAGTLYVTVNPNTVDFTGKLITLENSQGVAAPVTLTPLEKSNYRMNIGWTRGADNGFYEAKAKIAKGDLAKAQARVDMEQLKTVAKDLYKNHNKKSINEAASALYTTVSDVLDANAVKATYEGLDENGNPQEKSVFSNYELAVTAITPLSFNTLHSWNPTSIPGLSRLERFANNIIDKVDIKVNLGFGKVVVPTVKEIKLIDLTEEMKAKFKFHLSIDTTLSKPHDPIQITVPVNTTTGTKVISGEVKDVNGNVIGTYSQAVGGFDINTTVTGTAAPFDLHIDVEEDLSDEITELYSNLQKPMGDVNQMLADLQDFMDQIQPMLDNLSSLDNRINGQIKDVQEKVKNEIARYLDRFENAILSRASYVNEALQPVLLGKTASGYLRLSKIEKAPAKAATSTISLIATTYNVELLAPAYKKYIVCTGAWKADGTFDAAEAKAVNAAGYENFAKVIDGNERVASFTGKAGYKYRIVYQALDYHGKIASGRYYVQF